MYKTVNFNIYKEQLEEIIFNNQAERQTVQPDPAEKQTAEKPIPKPAPDFWKFPSDYKKN